MMMAKKGTCKNICKKHKAPKGKRSFKMGAKKCNKCAVFLRLDGYRCPCCNLQLQSRSHDSATRRDQKHEEIE